MTPALASASDLRLYSRPARLRVLPSVTLVMPACLLISAHVLPSSYRRRTCASASGEDRLLVVLGGPNAIPAPSRVRRTAMSGRPIDRKSVVPGESVTVG